MARYVSPSAYISYKCQLQIVSDMLLPLPESLPESEASLAKYDPAGLTSVLASLRDTYGLPKLANLNSMLAVRYIVAGLISP